MWSPCRWKAVGKTGRNRIMGTISKKCQVPTPKEVVDQMLDQIGYRRDLYGKRILENSCGEGMFLVEILRRYIQDCRMQGKSEEELRIGIQRDIHGFEKDRRMHRECISHLNAVAAEHGLTDIHWNIKRRNALPKMKRGRYQYVVGNPPYLSYPDQDDETRVYLRTHFDSCDQGKPDIYYAFIEASLNALAPDGKLVYLVPGNFMKNLYAEHLRQLLLPSLYQILNYSHQPLFEGYLTSSVILLCDRNRQEAVVQYEDVHYANKLQMPKAEMSGKWIFRRCDRSAENMVCFSDMFCAHAPVATQLNEAYLLKNWQYADNGVILCDKFRIEVAVVRDAAGPNALQRNQAEKILFPYAYDEAGILIRYSEEEFSECFPGAEAYLKQFSGRLNARCKDKKAKWFEYGRSQLLAHLQQEKLNLSTLITCFPRIYSLDARTVPYAGICVIAREGGSLAQARKILESPQFMDYVKKVGVCASGESYRISPRDINLFRFPRSLLEG